MDEFFEKISIKSLIGMNLLICMLLLVLALICADFKIFFMTEEFYLIISEVFLIWWVFYRAKMEGFNLKKGIKDFKHKNNLKVTFKIVIINIGLSLGATFCVGYFIYKINPSMYEKIISEDNLNLDGTILNSIYNFILVVCLAPIVEELTFRGIIFNRLKKRWNVTSAIIVSSVVFGCLHPKLSIIGATFFGAMMCIVYIKTKNIFVSMSIHGINNLIGFLLELFDRGDDSKLDPSQIIMGGKVGIIITLIFGILTLRYLIKNWPRYKKNDKENSIKVN